jgi:DNA-binding XRE family transcriptional regulator
MRSVQLVAPCPMAQQPEIPRNVFRPEYQRTVFGEMCVTLSGELMLNLARLLAPEVDESRQKLLTLRQTLGWSRAQLASFLGVSKDTLRRWETGERNPCGAARKLIWLAHSFITQPERFLSSVDVATWGKLKK